MADNEEEIPRRPSSWRVALSQLPGFPPQERPVIPTPVADGARVVSRGRWHQEDGENGGD